LGGLTAQAQQQDAVFHVRLPFYRRIERFQVIVHPDFQVGIAIFVHIG
jgi:hypothetical protein